MQITIKYPMLLLGSLILSLQLSSCGSDKLDGPQPPNDSGVIGPNGSFSLSLSVPSVSITEGAEQVDIPLTVSRNDEHKGVITLTATGKGLNDDDHLRSQFSDDVLSANEPESNLSITLGIGPKPIQSQTRNLLISATDRNGQKSTVELGLQVEPTNAPDVYLLIGQSNMMGRSQKGARRSAPGEPDAPEDSIRQLNVTFNDSNHFSSAEDFVTLQKIYDVGVPTTLALDPLHKGMQSNGSKEDTEIGLGLSFAKAAMPNTTSEIYLVPAAWSDTGFCKRASNALSGLGWNATNKSSNPALSGTLLHDRAVARANVALAETNGILRGILWHQGEADSEDAACAEVYAENLAEMIQSLRSSITIDARGPSARGPDADIPFIVGTMAKGEEQSPFSNTKLLVDSAHRNVSNTVKFTDFVNNDDLLPPAYSCGGGSCIHFGADALREMGSRYYEKLISVLQ